MSFLAVATPRMSSKFKVLGHPLSPSSVLVSNVTMSHPLASILACGFAALLALPAIGAGPRTVLSLDGEWDLAEGKMDSIPARFEHRVPVPGLADLAQPAFAEVGTKKSDALREAFWYRRLFPVSGEVPAVARLKIHKAAYGCRVYLNGTLLGEHLASFTPAWFDARPALRGGGATNELIVRVGASRSAVPPGIPSGADYEKVKYIPGLFDSVELILSGTPHLVRVQTAPDITNKTVRVQALVRNQGPETSARLQFTVREARSGQIVGTVSSDAVRLGANAEQTIEARVPIENCHLWSPDDPFLYELETATGTDAARVRFGMREFHFDPATGRAYLNGKPRFLRGSNVTLYRFFEDAERGDRPWRTEWVRRLHRRFKEMHWEALRYCIGFPPERWYEIADEEGFLIQDEFPIWGLGDPKTGPKAEELAREYTEWLQERWNHPCVVIWDAQNETVTGETGQALQQVRHLDLSHRPWDNGWGPPQAPGDCYESHPYMFGNPDFKLADVAHVSGRPGGNPVPNKGTNAILINEYGWLWLNRDGTPTTLTRKVYENLRGRDATPAQRRLLYARYLAAKTEFWRAHRACAGVLHFCGLGYSRPDGQTSDHFIDLENLTFEPNFFEYVREAFAPTGLMIDEWAEELPGGAERAIPVVTINDLDTAWNGTLRLRLLKGAETVFEKTEPCAIPALSEQRRVFTCLVSRESGSYRLEAALLKPGEAPVRSLRDFQVLTLEQKAARDGIAVGKPVKASSVVTRDGVTHKAEYAVDGSRATRWSSEFSDPQWLAIDLGAPTEISRVELVWEPAFAKAYSIQTSLDGESWKEVYTTTKGAGRTETLRFPSTTARWVRFYGTQRATPFGYSFWEMRVFRD
jgi:beta-galactosidase